MADPEQKFDRFHPTAPKIPGVPEPGQPEASGPAPPAAQAKRPPMALLVGGGAAVVLMLALLVWWAMRPAPSAAPGAPAEVPGTPAPAAATPGSPAAAPTEGPPPTAPGFVATVQELSKPWAAKRFYFRRQLTGEVATALIIRLPSGPPRSASGYWAFATGVRDLQCTLEFVTDLQKLASEYEYTAAHPMVVDPCRQRVFDPLKLGDVGGVWIRGDVVSGPAARPPLAILIRVEGDSLIAAQIE